MDQKEPQSSTTPAEPTSTLSTVEANSQAHGLNRGTRIFLTVAVATIAVVTVFALIFVPRAVGPVAKESYAGTWSQGLQSLTLEADGQAYGTDGCNRLMSSWNVTGDGIEFQGFASTMMACLLPNGKGMMNSGWILQSTFARLDTTNPNRLIFFSQSGKELGSMVRGPVPAPMPMPTSDPMFPGPDEPAVPGLTDDGDALVGPRPGVDFPEP